MPKILIRCPTLGKDIPTGLTTETIILNSIDDDLEIPLRCPACLEIHKWTRKDAWVDKENWGGHA